MSRAGVSWIGIIEIPEEKFSVMRIDGGIVFESEFLMFCCSSPAEYNIQKGFKSWDIWKVVDARYAKGVLAGNYRKRSCYSQILC